MITFKFFKIPVHIHPTYWLFLFVITNFSLHFGIYEILIFIIAGISLLAHEYGHALTALCYGRSPEIYLQFMGGYAQYPIGGITHKEKFFITLNGPLFSALLMFVGYFLFTREIFQNDFIHFFCYATYKINKFWLIANLLPIYPLDGGSLLRTLLEGKFKENGIKYSQIISIITGIFACGYYFNNKSYMFAGIFFLYGLQNLQSYWSSRTTRKEKKTPYTQYLKSQDAIKDNDITQAKKILARLIKTKSNETIKISAIESLADIYYQEDNKNEAYSLLLKTDHKKLKNAKTLLCKLAYEEKNFSLIQKYSQDIYELEPTYEIAILNAKSHAHLSNTQSAGGWLYTASQFKHAKKEHLQQIIESKVFDKVRNQDSFKKHIQSIYE